MGVAVIKYKRLRSHILHILVCFFSCTKLKGAKSRLCRHCTENFNRSVNLAVYVCGKRHTAKARNKLTRLVEGYLRITREKIRLSRHYLIVLVHNELIAEKLGAVFHFYQPFADVFIKFERIVKAFKEAEHVHTFYSGKLYPRKRRYTVKLCRGQKRRAVFCAVVIRKSNNVKSAKLCRSRHKGRCQLIIPARRKARMNMNVVSYPHTRPLFRLRHL